MIKKKRTLNQKNVHLTVISIVACLTIIPFNITEIWSLTPDFDGDGKVNITDFVLFAKNFGKERGQTGYDEGFDLNSDGKINIQDFTLFAKNFGRTYNKTISVNLVGGATMEMVWIAPGTFLMGSPDSEPERGRNEGPQHKVTITKGFYLGKYEVTQGQWESVMGTRLWAGQPYVLENPDYPAIYISWVDIQEFVQRLNKAEGAELYRLPTEAEWEYACRAGTTTRWSFGDDQSQLKNYAWYWDNAWIIGEEYPHRVGTKLPNPWGLYDMHGNVYEWVQDWYDFSYSSSDQVDPVGPSSGSDRVIRSGDFRHTAPRVRSAFRGNIWPTIFDTIGFRLLRQEP